MDNDDPKLMGVVLCGGRSRRMGRDKATLTDARGESFLDVAVERLGQLCGSVCVSTTAGHAVGDYARIVDPPDSNGPITGVLTSLQSAIRSGFDACLFNPVDTPNLSVNDLRLLVERWRHEPRRVVCAESSLAGATRLEPLIAIVPTIAVKELRSACEDGEFSLWRAFRRCQPITVTLSAESCLNVNSPADLEKLPKDL